MPKYEIIVADHDLQESVCAQRSGLLSTDVDRHSHEVSAIRLHCFGVLGTL